MPGVLDGGNLVYCAPTSGGKSLVAEILMLRRGECAVCEPLLFIIASCRLVQTWVLHFPSTLPSAS